MKIALQFSVSTVVCAVVSAATVAAYAAPPPPPQTPPVTSWELAGEFNDTTNPNPATPWLYCYKTGGALTFTCTPLTASPPVPTWLKGYGGAPLPIILHNTYMVPRKTVLATPQNITVPARGLLLHPGTNGQIAVVRFTAPAAAQYSTSGQFYGADANGSGTHTNVYIVVTNVGPSASAVYTGAIAVTSPTTPSIGSFTTQTFTLAKGDTVDYEVEAGPGNNYFYGSTGLHAVIQQIQPPCGGNPTTC